MYKLIDHCKNDGWWIMLYNATFNNISVILWLSFLLARKKPEYPEPILAILFRPFGFIAPNSPMQSMPIATDVVSSNRDQDEMYNIV